MYCISNICFMCLSNNKLINVFRNKENMLVKQMKFVLPEIKPLKMNSRLHICLKCCKEFDSAYIFKKKCMRKYNQFHNYINVLKRASTEDRFRKKVQKDTLIEVCTNELLSEVEVGINLNMEEELLVERGTERHVADNTEKTAAKVNDNIDLIIEEESFLEEPGTEGHLADNTEKNTEKEDNSECNIKTEIEPLFELQHTAELLSEISIDIKHDFDSSNVDQEFYQQILKSESLSRDVQTNGTETATKEIGIDLNIEDSKDVQRERKKNLTDKANMAVIFRNIKEKINPLLKKQLLTKSDIDVRDNLCEDKTDQELHQQLVKSNSKSSKDTSKNKTVNCTYCNMECLSNYALVRHMVVHTGAKNFKCSICGKLFSYQASLDEHNRVFHRIKIKCNICQKQFARKIYLIKHMQIHKVKKIRCSICRRGFTSKHLLETHKKIHLQDKFQCKVCNRYFVRENELLEHEVIHEGFDCTICNKKFFKEQHLKNHMANHAGIKEFECKVCHKQFFRKTTLKIHMHIHSGIKEFECPFCNKSFLLESDLEQHKVIHEGLKEFFCTVCNRKFLRNQLLVNHMLTHAKVKEFECTVCKKQFVRKSSLKNHMETHSEIKKFECTVCNKQFHRKPYLRKHMLLHGSDLKRI